MDNSNEVAQEPGLSRTRSGRSALGDIRAKITSAANVIASVTTGTKKRKAADATVEPTVEAESATAEGTAVVEVTQNPIAAPTSSTVGTRSGSRSNSATKAAPGTNSASKSSSSSSSSSASKSVTNSASKQLLPDALSQPEAAVVTAAMTQPLPVPTGSASKRQSKRQAVEAAAAAAPAPVAVAPAATTALTVPVPLAHRKLVRKYALRSRSADPSMCFEVIDDMYDVYYDLEVKYRVTNYMANQSDINFKMRAILVDWLVEVHSKFKLQAATLWLCVAILDRYLACTPILRSKLQLVGVTSLFIACKFEELLPPEVRDCVYITDFAYDREEVLKMESSILQKLNYDIHTPTGYHFLSRYLNCIRASERTRMLASYYCERNLQEADMFTVLPHVFAAAAVYSALKQQNCEYAGMAKMDACNEWSRALEEESGLTKADLLPTAAWLVRHVNEETQTTSRRRLIAAKKKYSQEKYHNVALLPLPPL